MIQTITPNPNIPCKPGWCLAYVNEAFGVPKRYGSATAAWNASTTKHRDYNFPNAWVPVWFSLPNEPNGHVALRAPDGTVYSTSDLTNIPHRHPDFADLMAYYAYYGMPLTYLGWTEDVEGTAVVAGLSYASESITVLKEGFLMALTDKEQARILAAADRINGVIPDPHGHVLTTNHVADIVVQTAAAILNAPVKRGGAGAGIGDGQTSLGALVAWNDDHVIQLLGAAAASAAADGASVDDIKAAVRQALEENIVKVDVSVEGAPRG